MCVALLYVNVCVALLHVNVCVALLNVCVCGSATSQRVCVSLLNVCVCVFVALLHPPLRYCILTFRLALSGVFVPNGMQ